MCAAWLNAQNAPSKKDDLEKPTTITSEQFNLDLTNHKGTFVGKVKVDNADFQMTSNEAIVYLTPDNKPERFVANGDIKLDSGERHATARQAEYFMAEKKVILTGEPTVMEKQNKVTGNSITIYPSAQKMEVAGRSTIQIFP